MATENRQADAEPTPGHKALEELDRVLAQEPEKDGKALTAATMYLGEFREKLISAQRDAPSAKNRQRLDHVNSIISTVLAVHFPLGSIPWDELKAGRGWLAALVSATE